MNQQTTLFSNEEVDGYDYSPVFRAAADNACRDGGHTGGQLRRRSGSIRCFTGKSVQYYFLFICLQHWHLEGRL